MTPPPKSIAPSHAYHLEAKALFRLLAWPAFLIAAFALLAHAAAHYHTLPPPHPTFDIDHTVLFHQVQASAQPHSAEVLLLGDSSCLMNVDAHQLGQLLNRPTLNLATLSYLDLNAAATLLRRFTAANPGRAQLVVLLLHPEALRRSHPEPSHQRLFHALIDEQDLPTRPQSPLDLPHLLGLDLLQGRILSRLLPTPLPGAYGSFYGFTSGLRQHLSQHHGSLLDPTTRPLTGSPEYRLAPQLESASRNLRAAVPEGTFLAAGLSPVPTAFATPSFPATRDRLLRQWGEWLQADLLLDRLPPTLEEPCFASTTHLQPTSVPTFTQSLAKALAATLSNQASPRLFVLRPPPPPTTVASYVAHAHESGGPTRRPRNRPGTSYFR